MSSRLSCNVRGANGTMTFGCYCRKSSRWMPRTNGSRWKKPAANHPLGLARRGDRQTVFWLTPMEMYLHDSASSL